MACAAGVSARTLGLPTAMAAHEALDIDRLATLSRLARDGKFDPARAAAAILELGLNPERPEPSRA